MPAKTHNPRVAMPLYLKPKKSQSSHLLTLPMEVWSQILDWRAKQEHPWLCAHEKPIPASYTFEVSYHLRLTCKATDAAVTKCLVHRIKAHRHKTPHVAGMPYLRGANCRFDRLTFRMTRRSLDICEAVSKNQKFASLIEDIQYLSCDFQLKLVQERMVVPGVKEVILDREETHQMRFFAEHQDILRVDSFRQTLKKVLPRLDCLKKLSFRRITDFTKDGEYFKFGEPAMSLADAALEDLSALTHPLYLTGFFQLAAEAAKECKITALTMFNIVPDMTFTRIRDRSIAAPVFENVEHLTLRCAADSLVRDSDGTKVNVPPGRPGFTSGEAGELDAWTHLLSKAKKLKSLELGVVKVYRKRLSGASALLNMFLYHTRLRHITELRLHRHMVDADLVQRFVASRYQQLRTARSDLLDSFRDVEDDLRDARAIEQAGSAISFAKE